MTEPIHGFPPIAAPDCRILILGSMPGLASLAAGQYYAHPANAFWRILGTLHVFSWQAPYGERVARLIEHRIAVWDVLKSCQRHGSLDSKILPASEICNDLRGFVASHCSLERIVFNGGKAQQVFQRRFPGFAETLETAAMLRLIRAPSTSPAHASLSFDQKCAFWRDALL